MGRGTEEAAIQLSSLTAGAYICICGRYLFHLLRAPYEEPALLWQSEGEVKQSPGRGPKRLRLAFIPGDCPKSHDMGSCQALCSQEVSSKPGSQDQEKYWSISQGKTKKCGGELRQRQQAIGCAFVLLKHSSGFCLVTPALIQESCLAEFILISSVPKINSVAESKRNNPALGTRC